MSPRIIGVVYRKELLDLLRDRRTLISLVLAPMLVGPLIMSGMNYYMRRSERQAQVERFKVGIQESVSVPGLQESLTKAGLEVLTVPSARTAVDEKKVTFGVEVGGNQQQPVIRFYSDNSDMTANMARRRVDGVLDGLARQRITAELAKHGVHPAVLDPFKRESINVAQPRKMTGAILGRMVGFLLLIFLFNGAMYAAVDCTAGEKERKTLEVLLSSAAGRAEIVAAKILIAVTTSFGTTAVTIASYAVAFGTMETKGPRMTMPMDPLTLGLLTLLIIPVAFMAASIAVAAATPAKSTREAMSYLTPGMFVVMFLGMVTFLPNMDSGNMLAAMPFANFCQTLREVLSGELSWKHYGITTAANLLYSAIAAAFAVRSFTSEKVLFRS